MVSRPRPLTATNQRSYTSCMKPEELVRIAVGVAATALSHRNRNVKVETPPPDWDKVREYAKSLPNLPTVPELSKDVLAMLESHAGPMVQAPEPQQESKTPTKQVGVACIPCTVSHIATCAGELNEAVRFAREDVADPEVGLRIDRCLSEIAAAERIDLSPENVSGLPPEEKEIADDAARRLRKARHALEWYTKAQELEQAAADMSRLQHDASEAWRQARLHKLSPEQRETLRQVATESATRVLEEITSDDSQTP